MKKVFTALFLIFLSYQVTLANWPVSTEPQPRNVVLEEFTGIYCGYCPYGHEIGQGIKDDNPGRVVLINIHTGNYAVPNDGSGHPDFRTPWGDALRTLSNLGGYPAGQVNRQVFEGAEYFQQKPGALALSRDGWAKASNEILNDGNSPVNIGAKVERVGGTKLEITVELYYTEDPGQFNWLNVALLESGYIGYQGGSKGGEEYVHNHILRDLVTGQWGMLITDTETGKKIERTFTYEITDRVDPLYSDLQLAVFVTQQDYKHIYTGIEIDVPSVEPSASLTSSGSLVQPITQNQTVEKTVTLENISDNDLTFDLSLSPSSEVPDGWTYKFNEEGISPLTLAAGESKDITYQITSGDAFGRLEVELGVQETDSELKLSYSDDLKCISSDARYYLVAIETAKQYSVANYIYNSGYKDFFEIDPDELQIIGTHISRAHTLIYDCGVDYIPTAGDLGAMTFLMSDNVNIMVMGNRVLGALGDLNGLAYFGVEYNGYNVEGFGSAPWPVRLSGVPNDPITYFMGTNFEGNLIKWLISLVEIIDETSTSPIMHFANDGRRVEYNSSTQTRDTFDIEASDAIFGVKVDRGESKHILLGLTPYVIVDQSAGETLMRKALDWLHGVSDVEVETSASGDAVTIWPNPVRSDATIGFAVETPLAPVSIKLVNSIGEQVRETPVEYLSAGEYTRNINVNDLPAGCYGVVISIDDEVMTEKMIIIN